MATKYVTLKDSNGDTLYPQISTDSIANGSLTTAKLADRAVTMSKLSATVLFTGFKQGGKVDLSDNISNYEYIEIYAQEIGNRKIYSKVKAPSSGDRVILTGIFPTTGGIYFRASVYTWGTSSLEWTESRDFQMTSSLSPGVTTANVVVLKVVGYK